MDLIIFLLALSILVLVHEFGHYLFAIKTGVKVEEFGLGLPPRMIGKKIGGTIFSLNWLPIGGFCKLYGEDAEGKGKNAFNNKSPWQKLLVVLGGVLMNLVLAITIFSVVYSIVGVPKETDRVKILEIAKDSPAQVAGLKIDDWIKEINGEPVKSSEQLIEVAGKYKGNKTDVLVNRGGEDLKFEIEIRENPPEGEGAMGVAISTMEMQKIRWYEFYKGISYGFKEAYYWGKIIGGGVIKMIGDLFLGKTPKDVSGPIGMYEATTAIKKNQGILAVIHFFGVVSVNLAVVNILPFPALDGGRILFVIYEMISRKKAKQSLEVMINNIGMWVLLTLILMITFGDLKRLFFK